MNALTEEKRLLLEFLEAHTAGAPLEKITEGLKHILGGGVVAELLEELTLEGAVFRDVDILYKARPKSF